LVAAVRVDLLHPLVGEMPADGDPQEDEEKGREEAGIVASRVSQGSAPLLGRGGGDCPPPPDRIRREIGLADAQGRDPGQAPEVPIARFRRCSIPSGRSGSNGFRSTTSQRPPSRPGGEPSAYRLDLPP